MKMFNPLVNRSVRKITNIFFHFINPIATSFISMNLTKEFGINYHITDFIFPSISAIIGSLMLVKIMGKNKISIRVFCFISYLVIYAYLFIYSYFIWVGLVYNVYP